MVRVSIRSEAPHWTLRSCATTNVPATEYAEGAGPRTLDIPLVEKFDWALMDGPTERTFCAEAVSDDLAGHTSGTIRTTLDTNIRVYFRPMPYDTYCPSPHYGNPIRTGSWNRGRFMAMWGGERGAAGIPVEAQYQQPADSGAWKSVGQLTSDASGFIYIGYRHDRDTNVRVCRPGTGCSQLAGEEWIYYTRAVAYASSAPSVHHGYRFPLFVTVLPRYAGREVLVYERVVQGKKAYWVRKGNAMTKTNGTAVVKIQAGSRRGVRVFKVFSPRDDQAYGVAGADVPVVKVTIR